MFALLLLAHLLHCAGCEKAFKFPLCSVCCAYIDFLLLFLKFQPLFYLRSFERGIISPGKLFLVEFRVYSPKFFKAFKVSFSWGLLWPIFKIITNSFPFLTYIFISLHSNWQLLLCFNLCLFLMAVRDFLHFKSYDLNAKNSTKFIMDIINIEWIY